MNSPWLTKLVKRKGSKFLKDIWKHPGIYHAQFIYTRIDRDANGNPVCKNYYLRYDATDYFNPASMVKLPTALVALEKINTLKEKGVTEFSYMLTDSSFAAQTAVTKDSTSESGYPSVDHYVKKIFLVSDNDAYNRLYELAGPALLNKRLREMGYANSRITRRFVPMDEDGNRHTNGIRFVDSTGHLLYEQQPSYYAGAYDFSRKLLIGKAHYDRNDSLIHTPMDFTRHNAMPLFDLQQMVQALVFPRTVNARQRFEIDSLQRKRVLEYMSERISDSRYPRYDTAEFFNSYTKFFWFRDGKRPIPPAIKSYNKTGWSYGFLTDVAYITDKEHGIDFMLSGTIYVNSDGILNDDKYDYDTIGFRFFREMGEMLYAEELRRKK
ncbi:hypothetical protein FPE01S_01_10700 [Flavihumibacter petaseus NBRC 106054]|uniref:Beta-lactamase class A catalytic domain-containing protein n=2 Tax=Flavihumibacter TaxID=1004301 RepID=A0A0E9MWE4_9BACT|nr:hypothetical protein FPE01S_01_10700 [Flavihumibacter petaseus NBRC 106054]